MFVHLAQHHLRRYIACYYINIPDINVLTNISHQLKVSQIFVPKYSKTYRKNFFGLFYFQMAGKKYLKVITHFANHFWKNIQKVWKFSPTKRETGKIDNFPTTRVLMSFIFSRTWKRFFCYGKINKIKCKIHDKLPSWLSIVWFFLSIFDKSLMTWWYKTIKKFGFLSEYSKLIMIMKWENCYVENYLNVWLSDFKLNWIVLPFKWFLLA